MTELPTFERIKTKKNKDLNLYVGLYYTVSVKSIPNCVMTYESEAREDTNLMQIALQNTEDYEPEGVFRDHALWTILPADNENNDYFLKVLSLPEGILTYSHSLSWGGRYLELDLKHPENYLPGATMHTSSLWHFEPSELPDYVTIHNSDDRRNLNFVTFSNEPSMNGQLMQIGTKDVSDYQPKGRFRNDALWNFRPANFILTAKICNFEFDLPSMEAFKSASIPIRVTDEIILVNDTPENYVNVDEKVALNETFVICFMQSFKMFKEENVLFDCNILKQICGSDSVLKFDKLTNTQWSSNQEREFPIAKKVLLDSGKSAAITGFCNWICNAELPFTATAEVRVVSDVAFCPTPVELHKVNTEIQDGSIVEYFLKYERFTGKVLPRGKGTDGIVRCQVSGRVKASFGIDTKLQVKYL